MQVFLVKHEQIDSRTQGVHLFIDKYMFNEFTFAAAPFQATA